MCKGCFTFYYYYLRAYESTTSIVVIVVRMIFSRIFMSSRKSICLHTIMTDIKAVLLKWLCVTQHRSDVKNVFEIRKQRAFCNSSDYDGMLSARFVLFPSPFLHLDHHRLNENFFSKLNWISQSGSNFNARIVVAQTAFKVHFSGWNLN